MWEHLYRLAEALSNWEFDVAVRKEIAEFSTLSEQVRSEFFTLNVIAHSEFLLGMCSSTLEKSMREKCLEALCICCLATPEKVCRFLHPSLATYPQEKRRRAMKAVSMTLLRLAEPNRHLVVRWKFGKTYAYFTTAEGSRRLRHYQSVKVRKEWEQLIVKKWDEVVNALEKAMAVCSRIWDNNTELLRRNGSGNEQMNFYGKIVKELWQRILLLQRKPSSDNLASQVEALGQNIEYLLNIGRTQADIAECLIFARDHWQKLTDFFKKKDSGDARPSSKSDWRVIRTFDADAAHAYDEESIRWNVVKDGSVCAREQKEEQERSEKQEKDRKAAKLFNALFLVCVLSQMTGERQ